MPSRPNPNTLSVAVPCFNEAAHLASFIKALKASIIPLTNQFEILVINDGSNDNTREIMLSLFDQGSIRYLEFSRNFGKEAALMAGIDYAKGDAVLLIDADFQHPLDQITKMAALWQEGYEMVYGVIINRTKEGFIKKIGVHLFYTLLKYTEIPIPQNAGDFRWLDRKVVNALKRLPERNRFMKGLYAWVGFKSIALPFVPLEREGGETSFSTKSLSRLALSGITSFSVMPLQVWTISGVVISLLAVIYGIYVVVDTIFHGNAVNGWPTLTVAIMLFSGIQLLSIGVLGEYIGRIYNEVKQRPLYVLADDLDPLHLPAKSDLK